MLTYYTLFSIICNNIAFLGVFMNLYLPVESDEEIEIEYNNNNYSLKERNGLFNIDTIIKNNNFFLVKRNGLILFKSTYNQIKYLEENIKVIKGITCLNTNIDSKGFIKPLESTKTFYFDDTNIVTVIELEGVSYECPVIVTLNYLDTLIYGTLLLIPKSEDKDKQHRSAANGIIIDSNFLEGVYDIEVKLVTGRLLYKDKINFFSKQRPSIEYIQTYSNIKSFQKII